MVHMEIVSHDEVFARLATVPTIANKVDLDSEEQRETLNRLLYTQYRGDSLDVLPSCDCQKYRGVFNVGIICDVCNVACQAITERKLESLIWIEAPEGIRAFMNPTVWIILSKALTVNGCNILEWLTNTAYKPPASAMMRLSRIQALDLPRGLNNFVDNFDDIMEALFLNNVVKNDKVKTKQDLWTFIQENRHKIFSRYLPIPSRIGFITEETAIGTYADTTMALAIDALRTITSIESAVTPLTLRGKEGRVVKSITQLAEFYRLFAEKTLSGKPGIFRRHVFGGRPHFSGRAVISSLSEPHDYEEVHFPWSLSVQLLRVHLINKLLKMEMSPIQIERFLVENTLRYHPLMDQLFQELIAESPGGRGIVCLMQRNPTLARASSQRFYIRKIKTDPTITTISVSVCTLAGCNADFDGDELNTVLLLDHDMQGKFDRLAPHLSALDMRKPKSISGNLKMPAPVHSTMSNYMYNGL
jgi:hypothetical protein